MKMVSFLLLNGSDDSGGCESKSRINHVHCRAWDPLLEAILSTQDTNTFPPAKHFFFEGGSKLNLLIRDLDGA